MGVRDILRDYITKKLQSPMSKGFGAFLMYEKRYTFVSSIKVKRSKTKTAFSPFILPYFRVMFDNKNCFVS